MTTSPKPKKRGPGRPPGRFFKHGLFVRLSDEEQALLLLIAKELETNKLSVAARIAIRRCGENISKGVVG